MPVVSDVDNGNGAEAKNIVAWSNLRAPVVPNSGESLRLALCCIIAEQQLKRLIQVNHEILRERPNIFEKNVTPLSASKIIIITKDGDSIGRGRMILDGDRELPRSYRN